MPLQTALRGRYDPSFHAGGDGGLGSLHTLQGGPEASVSGPGTQMGVPAAKPTSRTRSKFLESVSCVPWLKYGAQ